MVSRLLLLWAGLLVLAPEIIQPTLDDRTVWYLLSAFHILLLVVLFRQISPKDIDLRSGVVLLLLYETWVFTTDIFISVAPTLLLALEGMIFLGWFLWVLYRPIPGFKGDDLDEEHVFVTLYRPQSIMEMVVSLVGLPFGSLGVYAEGKWLRFRRGNPGLMLLPARPTQPKYMVLNTGIKVNGPLKILMQDLVGTPARHWTTLYFRCRCVLALRPLLTHLGDYWMPQSFFEFIPGVYAYRRLLDGVGKSKRRKTNNSPRIAVDRRRSAR